MRLIVGTIQILEWHQKQQSKCDDNMKEVRFFYVPDAKLLNELPTDEATHAIRVLRLSCNDDIFLTDGMGSFYHAIVTLVSNKHCFYEIKERIPQQPTWHGRIHLAIAPTKDVGRIEWMLEKATEIGFDEVSFLCSKFSERRQLRIDRMEKIVIAAMKQSHKAWKPIINPLISFTDFIHQNKEGRHYICHCYNEVERFDFFSELCGLSSKNEKITILIGPEGDFSIDEVKQAVNLGYKSVTLGQSRLRTETAGLEAVMMTNLSLRK